MNTTADWRSVSDARRLALGALLLMGLAPTALLGQGLSESVEIHGFLLQNSMRAESHVPRQTRSTDPREPISSSQNRFCDLTPRPGPMPSRRPCMPRSISYTTP